MMTVIVQIMAGAAMGYLAASVGESFQHRWFGHAPPRIRRLWKFHPRLFGWLRWVWWSHTVVHHSTASGEWFCSPLSRQAKALERMTPHERRTAVGTQFGLTIMLNSFIWFMWLPATALPIVWLILGRAGTAAALLPMFLPPLLSRMAHRYVHCPYDVALRESGLVVRSLLKTRYGRAMIRHHWLHHRYPGTNFNLLLGGDWVLGVGRSPTDGDVRDMEAQGIPRH